MKYAVCLALTALPAALAVFALRGEESRGKPRAESPPPKQSGKDQKPREAELMPLAERSRWEYEVTLELPFGIQKRASAATEVEGLVEIDGKTYYKVSMQVSGAPVNLKNVVYFRPTERGVYQMIEGEEQYGEWLFLPKHPQAGWKWSAATPKSKFKFEAIGREDLTCMGKTYKNCLVLSVQMDGKFGAVKQQQWLAPGVGLVKQIDDHALFESTAELKKYAAASNR